MMLSTKQRPNPSALGGGENKSYLASLTSAVAGPKYVERDEWVEGCLRGLEGLESGLRGFVKGVEGLSKHRTGTFISAQFLFEISSKKYRRSS